MANISAWKSKFLSISKRKWRGKERAAAEIAAIIGGIFSFHKIYEAFALNLCYHHKFYFYTFIYLFLFFFSVAGGYFWHHLKGYDKKFHFYFSSATAINERVNEWVRKSGKMRKAIKFHHHHHHHLDIDTNKLPKYSQRMLFNINDWPEKRRKEKKWRVKWMRIDKISIFSSYPTWGKEHHKIYFLSFLFITLKCI